MTDPRTPHAHGVPDVAGDRPDGDSPPGPPVVVVAPAPVRAETLARAHRLDPRTWVAVTGPRDLRRLRALPRGVEVVVEPLAQRASWWPAVRAALDELGAVRRTE